MAKKTLKSTITPFYTVCAPGNLQNLGSKMLKHISTKQVALDMVEIFRSAVNPYIPASSGALREKGYRIDLFNNKQKPKGKLVYRSTKAMPYVMYQYVGKIWQPNYAPFTVLATPDGKVSCKWTKEWKAAKKRHRHATALNFRRNHTSKWFKISNTGLRYKVDFYGYRNKDSQPRWVEYTESHDPNFRSNIARYAERVYGDAINQIAAGKQVRALRASGKQKASKTANEVLGINNNLKITTRLRKKK